MMRRILLSLMLLIGASGLSNAATPWQVGVFPPSTSYNGGYSTLTPFSAQLNITQPNVENFYTDMSMLPGTNGVNWENSSNYALGGFDTASVNGGPNNCTNPWFACSGVIPMGSIDMATQTSTSGALSLDTYLQNIAAGDYDTAYKGVIQDWYNAGYHTQDWRPGVEFNEYENIYNCGTDSTCMGYWRAAWDRIYTDMHAEASAIGANVTVIWNPGADAGGQVDPSLTTTYWPGAAYVDQIGLDLYDNSYPDNSSNTCANYTQPNITCANQSASPAFGLFEALTFAKAQGKAVSFDETGADTGDNPLFVQWLSGVLRATTTTIAFVSWWDSNGGCTCQFTPAASAGKPNMAAAVGSYFGTGGAGQTVTPSAANTQINGPINSITDTNGNSWSISLGQTLLENGVQDANYTLNPYVIYWSGSVLSVESSTGVWQTINLSTGAPTTASAPSGFVAPHAASPVGTTVNGTTGGIYDIYGNLFAINGSTQITINGVVVASSSGVTNLYYPGGAGVDQLNNAGAWYTQPPDGSSGTNITTPAGYGVTILPITASPLQSTLALVDPASGYPFSGVTITDPNAAQTETLRVAQSGTGVLSDPSSVTDGATVTGGNTVTGSGTAAKMATILNDLLFTPAANTTPGLQVSTTENATVTDTSGQTASLSSNIAATAPSVQAIIVTPATTVLSSTGTAVVHPFASVVISDANSGQNETATISISPSNGVLIDPNAGTDGSTNISNVITITSSSATTLANDIDAITFTPSASGNALATVVTASVRDTAGSVSAITSSIATASSVPSAAPGCLQTSAGCPSPAYNSLALGGHLSFFGPAPTSSNGIIQPNSADASGAIYEGSNQTSVTIHFNSTPAFVSAHCQVDSPNNAQFTSYTDPVTSTLTINHAAASGDQWVWKCN
jgi:hypothetical protein